MKIAIIGGTGHVGTYLVPRLVELGHEVTCVTRGGRAPYLAHAAWQLRAQGEPGPGGPGGEGAFRRRNRRPGRRTPSST